MKEEREEFKKKNRLSMRVAALIMVLVMLVQTLPLLTDQAHAYTQTGEFAYTPEELEGLVYVNQIRQQAGLQPLQLDRSLTLAARAHAAYSNANPDERKTLPHGEQEGHRGFTGKWINDRIKYFGGDYPYGFGEVMHFMVEDVKSGIDGWMNSAYHRTLVLSPQYDYVGFGLVDGTVVGDFKASRNPDKVKDVIVYPYEGMNDASIGFYGNEIPNPLAQFRVDYSGSIISATASSKISLVQAKITDEFGNDIGFYYEEHYGDNLYLYPREILEGYTTYHVSITYFTEDQPEPRSKTWSFRTGKGREADYFTAQQEEIVMNQGSPLPLVLTEHYTDGTHTELRSKVTYSSNDSGLKVSPKGIMEASKPGLYVVTFKAGKAFGTADVRVLEKLKTKNYAAADPARIKDISSRPEREAIEWALKSGVIAGDKNGNFRPNEQVTEAEFWTMLLRAYHIDYDSYAPKNKKHWADGAYKIAERRSIPLEGIKSTSGKEWHLNRLQVMEMIPALDGVNLQYVQMQPYVVAKNMMRGITGTVDMNLNDAITRAGAAQILWDLQHNLKEIKGKSVQKTKAEYLPEQPLYEVYTKPAIGKKMLFADYRADHSVTVEGNFPEYAGQALTVQIDRREAPNVKLEKVPVTPDANGKFSVTLKGPYDAKALNVYFGTDSMKYFVGVAQGKMSVNFMGE